MLKLDKQTGLSMHHILLYNQKGKVILFRNLALIFELVVSVAEAEV